MPVDYAGANIEWVDGTITVLELVKTKLGITGTDLDSELAMYISMAGSACEKYLDNKLVLQEVTETYAVRRRTTSLRFWPVVSLDSVLFNDDDITDRYELRMSDGVAWAINDFGYVSEQPTYGQLVISYTAGYDPLPGSIGYALAETAMSYYSAAGGIGSIKKEVVQGVGSVEYVTNQESAGAVGMIPGNAVQTLEMYRRWHV